MKNQQRCLFYHSSLLVLGFLQCFCDKRRPSNRSNLEIVTSLTTICLNCRSLSVCCVRRSSIPNVSLIRRENTILHERSESLQSLFLFFDSSKSMLQEQRVRDATPKKSIRCLINIRIFLISKVRQDAHFLGGLLKSSFPFFPIFDL